MAGLGFYEIIGAASLIIQIFDIQEEMIRTSSKLRKIFDWIENCPQERSHEESGRRHAQARGTGRGRRVRPLPGHPGRGGPAGGDRPANAG